MKKLVALTLVLSFAIALVGYSSKKIETGSDDTVPTIILFDRAYVVQGRSTNELPDGYSYIGTVSEESANDTGLAGCKMYGNKNLSSINDIYIYQECETSSKDTDGSAQSQWAYVQWVLNN